MEHHSETSKDGTSAHIIFCTHSICWLQTPALSISAAGKRAAQHQLPGQRLENPGHKAHSSLAMYPKVTGFRDCFS